MGLREKYQIKLENQVFRPLKLCEDNVKVIFNRCLAKENSKKEDTLSGILFSITTGYKSDVSKIIYFDKNAILDNKQNIMYLYGQLKSVHSKERELRLDDATMLYSGEKWTLDKNCLLEFLYLGVAKKIYFISIFHAETNSAVLSKETLKPTLSPKDPNFPVWWAEHKVEWETVK